MPRSLTASVIPFKESPDTPYILLTPDAISESTIISETLFTKVTDSLSYAYDHPKTLIKISPCEEMLYAAEGNAGSDEITYLSCHCHNFFRESGCRRHVLLSSLLLERSVGCCFDM